VRRGQWRVAAAWAALSTVAGQHPRGGASPRAAATRSLGRASVGGPPRGEGHERGATPVRVIGAPAGVALRLGRAPGRLALQLREFAVDRAQTPQTGYVLPPAHHEGAPPAGGPLLATGRLLQVSEPSMDGVPHHGPPTPFSGPHGCGPRTDQPGTMRPWSVPRRSPPACPTREDSRGPPHTPLRRGPQAWWALEDAWPVRHGVGLRPHGGAQHHCLER
jgi:hypothetical protein